MMKNILDKKYLEERKKELLKELEGHKRGLQFHEQQLNQLSQAIMQKQGGLIEINKQLKLFEKSKVKKEPKTK